MAINARTARFARVARAGVQGPKGEGGPQALLIAIGGRRDDRQRTV